MLFRSNGLHPTVESLALSAQPGQRSFFVVQSGFTTMNSLIPPPTPFPLQEIQVPTVTLDAYCRENGSPRVDVIKVDIEGGERELFFGARELLSSARPLLICEVLDWVTQPWGYQAREIVTHLKQYDYEWFDFREDGRLQPHREREQYPEIKNYLAVPHEKQESIRELIVDTWPLTERGGQ